MSIAIVLHLIAAVLWVGGLAAAVFLLRPALMAAELPPVARTRVWAAALRKARLPLWISIATLFASGLWMVHFVYGGFAGAGPHIHVMAGVAVVMTLVAAYGGAVLHPRLYAAVAADDTERALKYTGYVRTELLLNTVLGLFVVAVASGYKYLY